MPVMAGWVGYVLSLTAGAAVLAALATLTWLEKDERLKRNFVGPFCIYAVLFLLVIAKGAV
jgi:hypothetical protein